jgi:hypothetical protein
MSYLLRLPILPVGPLVYPTLLTSGLGSNTRAKYAPSESNPRGSINTAWGKSTLFSLLPVPQTSGGGGRLALSTLSSRSLVPDVISPSPTHPSYRPFSLSNSPYVRTRFATRATYPPISLFSLLPVPQTSGGRTIDP